MMSLRRVWRWLAALVGRSRFEREMSEEMAHHLDLEIRDRLAAGMTPAEARRTALRDFGGVERWKEESRSARGVAGWDALRQDLRYAVRTLRGSPGFTAVAVATLAVGIGATTSVFSVVDGLLLKPLDYREPDRVVRFVGRLEEGGGRGTISAPNYQDWMARSGVFEAGALYDEYRPTLRVGGQTLKVEAASVGARYFDVLGVSPAVGRFFLPEEDAPGSARVVLSWGLWRDAFGGSADVVGQVIDLNGFPYTVVGVAPPMEDPGLSGSPLEAPRLWRSTPSYFASNGRSGRSFTAVARLKPGVTLERAQAELSAIQAALVDAYPEENAGHLVELVPIKDALVGGVRPLLVVLLSAVGLVLLIACANVANLLLFRAAARGREMAMRTALGASRGRVVRQLMVESLLLALAGAVGGVALAALSTRGLLVLAAGQLPRTDAVGMDPGVLVFAVAAAAGAAFVFGLVPALHTSRVDVRSALAEGGRGATAGRGRGRLRAAGVTAQVALAVVVMLGAGLLGRSLLRLQAVDPGVAADRVAVLRIDPPPDPYDAETEAGASALLALYDRLDERLRAVPGVEAVGFTDLLPMSGSFNGNGFMNVGQPAPAPGHIPSAECRAVSPGYFETMEIPVLEGRGILPSDDATDASPRVIVVNQAFARRFFPDGAVGGEIRIFGPDEPPARIVGVAGDVTQFDLADAPEPVVYVPTPQAPSWMQTEPWITLRTAADPAGILAAARAAIQEVEPRTPVYQAHPMNAVVATTLARPRFRTFLLLAFAAIAFLLAAIGVYGMVAYTVARRLPELGIRMAMGADTGRILRHVLGQGIRPVAVGAAIGLAIGAVAVRVLTTALFQVTPTDPVTFMAVPAALLVVAAAAAFVPARRATTLDPARVLRAE